MSSHLWSSGQVLVFIHQLCTSANRQSEIPGVGIPHHPKGGDWPWPPVSSTSGLAGMLRSS